MYLLCQSKKKKIYISKKLIHYFYSTSLEICVGTVCLWFTWSKLKYNTVLFFLIKDTILVFTYTHTTINMIFLCLLNFQLLEAPIVLSGCIISRFSSHKCVYPSNSAHICKRETHRCFTRGALTSLNSDFFNCPDIISQMISVVVPAAQNSFTQRVTMIQF